METINIYTAIKKFKEYSENNIPVKLIFYTYNEKESKSNGIKIVDQAFIRNSFRADQSDKHDVLINYIDENAIGNKNKSFYLPLLISVNDVKVVSQ